MHWCFRDLSVHISTPLFGQVDGQCSPLQVIMFDRTDENFNNGHQYLSFGKYSHSVNPQCSWAACVHRPHGMHYVADTDEFVRFPVTRMYFIRTMSVQWVAYSQIAYTDIYIALLFNYLIWWIRVIV